MQFIRKILRLRRQNDAVNLAFLFGVAAIVAGCFAVIHGRQYAGQLTRQMEYIVMDSSGTVSDAKIQTIFGLYTVACVSRNLEQTITLKNGEQELSMSCVCLEEAYIRQVYEIEDISSMQTFYANTPAFEQIKQALITSGYENPTDEMQVSYLDTEEYVMQGSSDGDDSLQYKTAKIIRVDTDDTEEPFLFCVGNPLFLKQNAFELRVLVSNQSESHNVMAHLGQLSMSVENTEAIEEHKQSMDVLLLKVRYECMIVCISLVAAIAIGRMVRQR